MASAQRETVTPAPGWPSTPDLGAAARPLLTRSVVAVASVAAVAGLRLLLLPVTGDDSPFFLLFAAVVLSAWYGGLRAGLVATVLAAAAGHVLFVNPEYALVKPRWGSNLLVVEFLAEGGVICYLTARLRWAWRQNAEVGEELRLLVDGVPDLALVLLDPDGRVRSWNQGAERLTGYAAADVLGRHLACFYPPGEAGDGKPDGVLRAAAADERATTEGWLVRKDGSWFWAGVGATPLRAAGRRPTGFVLMIRDVTARRQAELALKESEQRLRLMADTLPVLIGYVDANGRYQFNNANYEHWFGVSPEACRGRHVREVIGEAAYAIVKDRMAAVLRGRPQSFEAEVPYPRGGPRHVHLDLVPHRAADGRVLGYYSLALDVTDRKQAETALRASEERLRAIVTTAADAIVTLDRRGVITSVNPATERMFGYTAAELVGRNVGMLMSLAHLGDRGNPEESARTSMRKAIGTGREVRAVRKDGSTFPVELSVSETGSLGLFTGIIRDVSRRLELEREVLEAAAREQRRIGQELHDHVGQELTGLGLLTDALGERLQSADPAPAEIVAKIAAGLKRVHEDVRALSRGLVPVEVSPNGLRAALAGLAAQVGDQAGVRCSFEADEFVRAPDPATATHLVRITQEAVSNALRHGRPESIHIALRAEYGQLVLEIHDDGVGIGESPVPGAGLGLRLMEYRASLIGGTVAVGPGADGGTRVACSVPNGSPRSPDGVGAR